MNNEIKLVKQIGIKEATKLIDEAERFRMHLVGDDWDKPSLIFRDDLKQIVDAFELVEKVGGLDNAKTFDESCMYCIDHLTTLDNLKNAINLVDKCNA